MKTNTGKLRDLEGRQQQLLRLVELSMTLNSTLDLDELLQTITSTATGLLDCEASSILLYDEKNPRLYFLRKKTDHLQLTLRNIYVGKIFLLPYLVLIIHLQKPVRLYLSLIQMPKTSYSMCAIPLVILQEIWFLTVPIK